MYPTYENPALTRKIKKVFQRHALSSSSTIQRREDKPTKAGFPASGKWRQLRKTSPTGATAYGHDAEYDANNLAMSVGSCDSASETWYQLKDRFDRDTGNTSMTLFRSQTSRPLPILSLYPTSSPTSTSALRPFSCSHVPKAV